LLIGRGSRNIKSFFGFRRAFLGIIFSGLCGQGFSEKKRGRAQSFQVADCWCREKAVGLKC